MGRLGILKFLGGQHLPQGRLCFFHCGTRGTVYPFCRQSVRPDYRRVRARVEEGVQHAVLAFAPKCADEVQPVDAVYGKLFKVYVGKALDGWLLNGDNVRKWESNKLTALDRRILITQWTGEAAKQIDRDIRYRISLFEETGLATTADGSRDNLINREGVERGTYSFIDVDTTPELLEDVLPISPAPADEKNPPGSSDEDESG